MATRRKSKADATASAARTKSAKARKQRDEWVKSVIAKRPKSKRTVKRKKTKCKNCRGSGVCMMAGCFRGCCPDHIWKCTVCSGEGWIVE